MWIVKGHYSVPFLFFSKKANDGIMIELTQAWKRGMSERVRAYLLLVGRSICVQSAPDLAFDCAKGWLPELDGFLPSWRKGPTWPFLWPALSLCACERHLLLVFQFAANNSFSLVGSFFVGVCASFTARICCQQLIPLVGSFFVQKNRNVRVFKVLPREPYLHVHLPD